MPFAFADLGVAELVRVLTELDVEPGDVDIQLVGGSGLMSNNPVYDGPLRLVRVVEDTLAAHCLVVRTRHLGGSRARHVHQAVHGKLLVVMTGGQQ